MTLRPTDRIEYYLTVVGLDRGALTGAGSIHASALETGPLELIPTGVGGYAARHLFSIAADVSVIGVGSATVRVQDQLRATIGGSGSVFYIGDPVVESSISGSGRGASVSGSADFGGETLRIVPRTRIRYLAATRCSGIPLVAARLRG